MLSITPAIVLVAGCHRSGSSAISYGIHALGAALPDNQIPAGHGNPRGYAESFTVMNLNEQILHCANSDWTGQNFDLSNVYKSGDWAALKSKLNQFLWDSTIQHPCTVIKDPRITLVWPLWRDELESLHIEFATVAAVRHPIATVHSLMKRDHFPEQFAIALWQKHAANLLEYNIQVYVDYDRVMDLPEFQLLRIREALSLPEPDKTKVMDFCHDFLDPALQRNSVPSHTRTTSAEINSMWDELDRRSRI